MSLQLDPRLHPYRSDLAAKWLEGQVEADRFVDARKMQVSAPSAPMRNRPRFDASFATEALLGETVHVLDQHEGWAWCQLEDDGYVGYMSIDALSEADALPTHKVAVPFTTLYPAPDIKTQPARPIGMGAKLAVTGQAGKFSALSNGHFVFSGHLLPMGETRADFVEIAEGLLRVPYVWGGKQWTGIDCSGLVQLALQAAGLRCPRDSDMQEASLGQSIDTHGFDELHRGDLVFWPGHVGMMVDADILLHATAHYMQVVMEPLFEAVERIREGGTEIRSIRRV